jgi:hypothetical protein
MTKAIPKECRNGHARIPENRSPEDKCLVCALVRRRSKTAKIRQARRAANERAQTRANLALRKGKSSTEGGADEVVRSTKILGLMDKLETALTSHERQHIQQQIRDLA